MSGWRRPYSLATQETGRTPLDEERLISLRQAAAESGLSHPHLRWLARKGKLEANKMGRDWFTTRRAVDHYLKNEDARKYDPRKNTR